MCKSSTMPVSYTHLLLLEKELPAQLDEESARALADELAASLTTKIGRAHV